MYFSEYSSFIHSLLRSVHCDQETLPSFFVELFHALCRDSSLCINRYEVFVCLAFFLDDFYKEDNCASLWNVLVTSCNSIELISSLHPFAEAIIALSNLFFPHLLENLQKTRESTLQDITLSLAFFLSSNKDMFMEQAPSKMIPIDSIINFGNGLLNNHIQQLLQLFSFHNMPYKDILDYMNSFIHSPTIAKEEFIKVGCSCTLF